MGIFKSLQYRVNLFGKHTTYALSGLSDYLRIQEYKPPDSLKIAVVMVGRNDDYMPDFADRLKATIIWNSRYIADEIVFVEWNPPEDRELLGPALTKKFQRLKVFVVPHAIHQKVCHNPRLPLMEYHAKNVGMRRAKSDWIIATNADVAMAPDTILACKSLDPELNTALTAERIDIYWAERRTKEIGLPDCLRYIRRIPYTTHGTGDFLMASLDLWHQVRGYDEKLLKHRIGCDVRGAAQMIAHGARISRIGRILHLAHPTSCTESVQPHHGEYAPLDDLPYTNSPDWGLGNCREIQIAERVWQLELPT